MAKTKKHEKKKLQSSKDADLVTLAKKKRYIALLEKMQRGQILSPSEIKEIEKRQKGPVKQGAVSTIEEVAMAFGVSVRTVFNWLRDGAPAGDGEYDLLALSAWRTMRSNHKPGKGEKEQWDVEYRRVKFLLAEIELKQKLGELLPRQEVEENMSRAFLKIRMQFQALPRRIVPQLEGLEINEREALLTDRIEEICHELGQDLAADDATWNRFNEFLNQEVQRNGDQGKTEVAGECPRGVEDPAEGKQEKQESPGEEGQGG
jgi:DNA-binding transcriptional regulator YiaG